MAWSQTLMIHPIDMSDTNMASRITTPHQPSGIPISEKQPSSGTGNWADSDKWLLDSLSAARGTLQSRPRRENNGKQPPQNSFSGLMQMDGGWREAKRGTARDTDEGGKKYKEKLPSTLPAAVWCSNTQSPFSRREMTFWDVEKLDAEFGCDPLIGLAEAMERLHLVQKSY